MMKDKIASPYWIERCIVVGSWDKTFVGALTKFNDGRCQWAGVIDEPTGKLIGRLVELIGYRCCFHVVTLP